MTRRNRNLLIAEFALLAICAVTLTIVFLSKNVAIANLASATVQESKKEDAYRNVEVARAALRTNPSDAWARIRMSGYYMDRKNYPAAIQEFKGEIQLGVKPFQDAVWQWHPAVNGLYSSPISLLFKNGELVELKSYPLSHEELMQWLRAFIDHHE